jgi:hypothetical protein
MTIPNKSKFGEPVSHKICMFYDGATGQIAHVHQYIQYPGGPTLTEEEVKAQGLAVLSRRMKPDVRALIVAPGDYQEGSKYRVDVASQRLIAA